MIAPDRFTGTIPPLGLCEVRVAAGRIQSVTVLGPASTEHPLLCPGFVDTQINGFHGVDFSDPTITPDQVEALLDVLFATGVTTLLPTLISNSPGHLEAALRNLEDIRDCLPRFAQAAPGYHLEGPFLSAGASAGAHQPQWMRDPDWPLFSRLQEAARGHIAMVTIAPERTGAVDFCRRACAAGIRVALGHTDGSADDVHALADAGATVNTHLGNGCPQELDRHHAPFWAQLNNDTLMAGLICDGFHLSREMIRLITRTKGLDRCFLVSDAVHVAGLPPGGYSLQGKPIELLSSGQVVTADRRSMAGSTLRLNAAIEHLAEVTGCSIEAALACASTIPAALLHQGQACRRIAPGEPAHFITLSVASGRLQLLQTVLAGQRVYAAEVPGAESAGHI